ncbi:MAG: beta-lactamase family protein [Aureispira sp.]|nr:beta-lactamase family protein [Aureispira sp.]
MSKFLSFLMLGWLAISYSSCKKYEISSTEDFETCVKQVMKDQKIPAVAALVFQKDKILHEQYFGSADLEKNVALDAQHMFLIASISKTITATALMKLYEQDKFQLDDAISNHLPFTVEAPEHKSTPITFRMLLTHTSSIIDNSTALDKQYYYGEDSPTSLKDFFEGYFTVNGQDYDAELNFSGKKPGTTHEYSNAASALIGVLVEQLSGKPFDSYCQQQIFTPLDMNNTSWRLANLDSSLIVRPYLYEGGDYTAVPHYTFTDYPNGGLRTTAQDLFKFLSAYAQNGQYQNKTLLQPATISEIFSEQIPDVEAGVGLHWFLMDTNRDLWGHNGGEKGVSTNMVFHKGTQIGVIILSNGNDGSFDKLTGAIYDWALEL